MDHFMGSLGRSAATAIVCAVISMTAACGPDNNGTPDEADEPAAKAVPEPDTAGSPTIAPPAQDLANKSAREQRVLDDAAALEPLLNQFWADELTSVYQMSFDPPDAFRFYRGDNADQCDPGSTRSMANNAFYCSLENKEMVEFDLDWLQSYLVDYPDDATTFLILAHEWGHAVQDSWTEQQPGKDSWIPTYKKELSADCLAGVFLQREIADGTITEDAGDADAIWNWLFTTGSGGWLNPGDHGTSEQRQRAFSDGYLHGTDYCRVNY